MDSDGLLGHDDGGSPGQATPKEKEEGAAGEPSAQVKAETLAGTTRTLPVVHSVVFKADSSRAEGTDQLMNLLRSTSLKAEAPPPPPPSPTASSGGFTQLLRALNYDQAKEPAGTESGKRAETAPAGPTPSSAMPMPQVTSFQTQPGASAPGSFTQMFQALDATPPEPAKPGAVAGAAAPENKTVAPEPIVQLTQPAASPGSFTQMFRTLDASSMEDAGAEPHARTEASAPGSFTQMFAAVSAPAVAPLKPAVAPLKVESAPKTEGAESASALPAPGSFTQMFRTLDAAPVPAKENEAATAAAGSFTQPLSTPAALPVPAASGETSLPVPAAAPGSFTQMFRTLDAAPVETARVEAQVPPITGSGSFTQMFSTPPEEPVKHEAPPVAGGTPGAFTQMFSTPPVSAPEPTSAQPQPPPAESHGSFTQMFRTLDAAPLPVPPAVPSAPLGGDASRMYPGQGQQGAPPFSPFEGNANPQPPQTIPTHASAGGLTQLLRTLDQPSQTPSRPVVPAVGPPPGGGQQPGSFTSVYGTLGGEAAVAPSAAQPAPPAPRQESPSAAGRDATQAFRIPQPGGVPPAGAPAEAGPSEFTRILNASMLRESALRGGGEAAVPSAAAPPAAAPAAAPPWGTPAAPKLPEAPKLPPAPKVPEVKLPAVPKAAVPGGMQQYLPLLMILIVFLLLAILVAVVFLMKR